MYFLIISTFEAEEYMQKNAAWPEEEVNEKTARSKAQ